MGLPGRFSAWCEAALAALLGPGTAVETVPNLSEMLEYARISPSLEAIARCLISTAAPHLVVGIRKPDERLRSALAQTGTRFVVALDMPKRAVADASEAAGADLNRTIRAVANSCAAVMRFP